MTFLFWALALCALTTYTLREGLFANGRGQLSGFDTEGFLLGIAAFGAAAWFFGPLYGVALVISIMVHEYGHVAAYRICGHHDARFRLIPLMGGVAISDRAPGTQLESFFISLMGPAICLAPMALAFALSDIIEPYWFEASNALWIFGSVTGIINFFNLLPFWPLDGGRCLRNIAYAFWPALATFLAVAMSAAFAAAALWMQSTALFIFALFGAQSLLMTPDLSNLQDAIPRRHAIIAAAAYGFTLAAHFVGGFALIVHYIL
ncbi:metalloprotease [Parasulfitobacter algicola]|uniref:Metalloprotease n=1 Tax=Parasulfitobacter algicola TaxID=2614809 RepID=A0ABX2IPW5_9RHOB|nr:metalloprotease [Sulfitobacter algicola]NSX54912.1 metalloprotease [Sulfitobacter algicola]